MASWTGVMGSIDRSAWPLGPSRSSVTITLAFFTAACAPPTQRMELPILFGTSAVILASETEVLAFDPSAADARTQLDSLDLTGATRINAALYRCSPLELGLESGLLRNSQTGQPLPVTRCRFSRTFEAAGLIGDWQHEAAITGRLAEFRVERAAEACFPAYTDPGCEASEEGYDWELPSTGRAEVGSGRTGLIRPDFLHPFGYFGSSLAIDGDTFVAGLSHDASCEAGVNADNLDLTCPGSGAALVYRWTKSGWRLEARLKPSHVHPGQDFGRSVAISGSTVVVGAHLDSACASGVNQHTANFSCTSFGAAFVFRRNSGSWRQEALLKASNPTVSDWFGKSVDIDGDLAVIGAPGEDSCNSGVSDLEGPDGCTNSGTIYMFHRSGDEWRQERLLKSGQPEPLAGVGSAVSLSNGVLVAATNSPPTCAASAMQASISSPCARSGLVEVFSEGVDDAWRWVDALEVPERALPDQYEVSVVTNGDRIFVGNPGERTCGRGFADACTTSGSVLIFRAEGNGFALESQHRPVSADHEEYFGSALAVSGETLLVGAARAPICEIVRTSTICEPNGKVYVYRARESGFDIEAELSSTRTGLDGAQFGLSVATDDGFSLVGAPHAPYCRATLEDEGDHEDCAETGAIFSYDPPLP